MCRALKVLCAASSAERLAELKRATVSAHWELVGGAVSVDELVQQVELHRPDVVVVDESLGPAAVEGARRARPSLRLVALGLLAGADVQVEALERIRDGILGVPKPGGPILA